MGHNSAETTEARILPLLEINRGNWADLLRELVAGFQKSGSPIKAFGDDSCKSLKRAEMKKALFHFVDQGFEIYLWLAEIELNGVPNGIRTRVARMKIWCPRPG